MKEEALYSASSVLRTAALLIFFHTAERTGADFMYSVLTNK
jgi:hypothetical protein